MTKHPKGECARCGDEHDLIAGGLVRRHTRGMQGCPGSHQPPVGGLPDQPQPAVSPSLPDPPDEPTYERSCDGGGCEELSVGWRWYRNLKEWLPVCGLHMDGGPSPSRIYDQPLTKES